MTKHREAGKTRLYQTWKSMRKRCRRKDWYIKNNITVCPEWDDYVVFRDWVLKTDNSGNYEPDNCQFITLSENAGKDKKVAVEQLLDGKVVGSFDSCRGAEKQVHVGHTHIVEVCKGKRKKAGGFEWRYNGV